MQPIYHSPYSPNNQENSPTQESDYEAPQAASIALQNYASFLDDISEDLSNADDDSMRLLLSRICWIKPLFTDRDLQTQIDNSEYPYESFNSFDYHLISAIETAAKQQTSPDSSKIRQALVPVVSVRRNLLPDFDAVDDKKK